MSVAYQEFLRNLYKSAQKSEQWHVEENKRLVKENIRVKKENLNLLKEMQDLRDELDQWEHAADARKYGG